MKSLSDAALTLVSRLSERLGPVTTLIDSTMDRLVGQPVVQACPGVWCTWQCYPSNCGQYGCYWKEVDGYSPSTFSCDGGFVNCYTTTYYWAGWNGCPQ